MTVRIAPDVEAKFTIDRTLAIVKIVINWNVSKIG